MVIEQTLSDITTALMPVTVLPGCVLKLLLLHLLTWTWHVFSLGYWSAGYLLRKGVFISCCLQNPTQGAPPFLSHHSYLLVFVLV